MAFTSALTASIHCGGGKTMSWGTFTSAASDSGGVVSTGLLVCDIFIPTVTSHVGAGDVKVSSKSGGSVTIVTDDGVDGTWLAIGHK